MVEQRAFNPWVGGSNPLWRTNYPGVAQMVERVVWDHEAGSSNLPTRTNYDNKVVRYMTYNEEVRDLFTVSDDYYLAHCISADFGMGKGIVVEFNKRFDMKRRLKSKYPDYLNEWRHNNWCGDCILEGRVLNLITKERYFHKPSYESLLSALLICHLQCVDSGIKKIAMPIIGCGLDKLQWDRVSEIIKNVFKDTDIDILVCKR